MIPLNSHIPTTPLPDLGDWLMQREQYRAEIAHRKSLEGQQQLQDSELQARTRYLGQYDQQKQPAGPAPLPQAPMQQPQMAPQVSQPPADPIQAAVSGAVQQATARLAPGMPLTKPPEGYTAPNVTKPAAMSQAANEQAQGLLQAASAPEQLFGQIYGQRRTLADVLPRDLAAMAGNKLPELAMQLEGKEDQRQSAAYKQVGYAMLQRSKMLMAQAAQDPNSPKGKLMAAQAKAIQQKIDHFVPPRELMELRSELAYSNASDLMDQRQTGQASIADSRNDAMRDRDTERLRAQNIADQNRLDEKRFEFQKTNLERQREDLNRSMLAAVGKGNTSEASKLQMRLDAVNDKIDKIVIPGGMFSKDTVINKPKVGQEEPQAPVFREYVPTPRKGALPMTPAGDDGTAAGWENKGGADFNETPGKDAKTGKESQSYAPPKSLSLNLTAKNRKLTSSKDEGGATKTQEPGDQVADEKAADPFAKLKKKKKVTSAS